MHTPPTKFIRLSDFNRMAKPLRVRLVENGEVDLIPLTSDPVKYRKGFIPADAYFISYEAFLAYQKAYPETPIKIQEIKSSNDFFDDSKKAQKEGQPIFKRNSQSAIIITMNKRGGEIGTCYIALSPDAAALIESASLDFAQLSSPQESGALKAHMAEIWGKTNEKNFSEGKGTHVSIEGFRHGDKTIITNRTDDNEIVWIGNKTAAAVSPEIALRLKALLFPNNGHIIKTVTARSLRSNYSGVFDDITTSNSFYRIESHEHGNHRSLFTLIPDHAARFLNMDANGHIHGLKETPKSSIEILTHAWIYTNFNETKIYLTQHAEKVANELRFDLASEEENIIRRMLGISTPEHVTIQDEKFLPSYEQAIRRSAHPKKGLTVPETVTLRGFFNPLGQTTGLNIEFSQRPRLAQFIMGQTQELAVKAGRKEFVLAAA